MNTPKGGLVCDVCQKCIPLDGYVHRSIITKDKVDLIQNLPPAWRRNDDGSVTIKICPECYRKIKL